jgi:hypothetical protein
MQPFSPTKKLVQTLVLTKLKDNVDVFWVLEEMLELDHVLMRHRAVNLDLTHELLFGTALNQGLLAYYLGSQYRCVLCLQCLEFVALSESTLS